MTLSQHFRILLSALLLMAASFAATANNLPCAVNISQHPTLPAKSSAQPYKYSGNELTENSCSVNHRLRQRMSRDAGKASRRSWIAVGKSQADGGNYDTNNGLNFYDFHARQHDPYAPHFTTIDPLAEVTPGISPYVFCAGNAIRFTDYSGLIVDTECLKLWNKEKQRILKKRDKLFQDIEKLQEKSKKNGNNKKLSQNIDNKKNSLSLIDQTLKTIKDIEISSDIYSIIKVTSGLGDISYNVQSNRIVIKYTNTANFIHEVTHGGQYESGELAFGEKGTLAQDIYDEIAAYKAQYAYDPSSLKGISIYPIKSITDISHKWLEGILYENKPMYTPDGYAQTGLYPVNINSSSEEIHKAYFPEDKTSNKNYSIKKQAIKYKKL